MEHSRKENYQKTLDGTLATVSRQIQENGCKPSLLLHACCAPCSSYVLEYLSPYFDISVYYYNPNIYPQTEYARRLSELETFIPRFSPSIKSRISLIETDYDPDDYFRATAVREHPELQTEPERGERCMRCYRFRMEKAYAYAGQHQFQWFTTTLSISPFKDAEKINMIGRSLEHDGGPRFLTADFKKKNGFLRSLEISRDYNLYRQEYCGCIYSYGNRNRH